MGFWQLGVNTKNRCGWFLPHKETPKAPVLRPCYMSDDLPRYGSMECRKLDLRWFSAVTSVFSF